MGLYIVFYTICMTFYFYATMCTEVTIVEYMPTIVPVEDAEVSKQLERSFKKAKMTIKTSAEVTSVDTSGTGCKVTVKTKKGEEIRPRRELREN